MSELTFTLNDVLVLAEHALAAPSHTAPVDNGPPGPALLLLTTDGGACLLSNGLPQLDAAPGQPHICGLRAVYAENATHCVTGPDADSQAAAGDVLSLPLTAPAVRRLRANADSHDLFTLTLTATHTILGVARRHPGGASTLPPATAGG